jgi:hypothetical protein
MASGAVARLMVEILGDSKNAVQAFKQTGDAAKTTEGAANKTGLSFAGIAKGVATGLAVKKVIDFGRESVKAAEESAVAHNRLVATFAQAGDSTGAMAAAAEKYAGSLSKATGVDDEAIMGAQALLATFHSLTTPTAKQADLFNRATAAAADLAAAGFGSLDTNATQLGKALEDPTKGMTALAKSGVSFSDAQKEQIKQMQKSGDLLGAQKIVMAGVEDQVKGTAQATATESAKMSVAWGNFQESVGAALLPFIDKITSKLTGLFEFVSENSGWLVPLVTAMAVLVGGLLAVTKTVALVSDATKAFTVVWKLLNLAFITSPIGLIIAGVVALIAVIVLIAVKTTWFQSIFSAMGSAVTAVWNGIKAGAAAVFNWIKANWPLLLGILTGPFGLAIALIIRYWSQIGAGAANVVSTIASTFAGVTRAITAPFEAAWAWIQSHILGPLKGAWNAIAGAVNSVHISISVPDWVPGIGGKGFTLDPPDVPHLARGGLLTASGLVYAHVGEVISPAPQAVGGGGTREGVHIERAYFSERIDVEVLMRQATWYLQTQRI